VINIDLNKVNNDIREIFYVQMGFISYSFGDEHSCYINQDFNMKCFGRNLEKQLGFGDDEQNRGDDPNEMDSNLAYVDPGVGNKFKSVYCGGAHTCSILTNDKAKCWGWNYYGQLGIGSSDTGYIGNTGDSLPFIDFGDVDNIKPILFAVGGFFTCILFDNKKVKCFGQGENGALGYENTKNIGSLSTHMGNNLPFVNLGTDILVSSIHTSSSAYHNCIIIEGSQLMKCWGLNDLYGLGYDDNISRGHAVDTMGNNLPTLNLGSESKVVQVGVGQYHTCAIRIDKELLCWGYNVEGRLGLGTTTSPIPTSSPLFVAVKVDSDTKKKAKYVSAGNDHTCVLLDNDISAKCVGGNKFGQLGQGDKVSKGNLPSTTMDKFPIINLGNKSLKILSIGARNRYTCVLFIDSTLKCFGQGQNGKLGSGSITLIGTSPSDMGSKLLLVKIFGIQKTNKPTKKPKSKPTKKPVRKPTIRPTKNPTNSPINPTLNPTFSPILSPTTNPTLSPKFSP